ncbi:FAD-dependent monooxygenase [Zobellella aerophila]|uniref:FAD-dependent oxidoreductase n=1 Tax=Zobellella aerophila TaxID=870480 RepID=A0ABP6VVR8_9GAMM
MHQPDMQARTSLYYDYQLFPFVCPPELKGKVNRHPVAIVGAGPIGLLCALNLAQQGVASVVLESEAQVSMGSRAIVFTRRSMEILQQAGVAERMLEKALPWRCGNSFYQGKRVFRMEAPHREDDRFEPLNNLQQQYLEQYLLEQAAASPLVEVRWASKVVTVSQDQEGVLLGMDTPEGEYQLQADWLIAADGARSHVRKALGLRMTGSSYSGNFVIADIRIDLDLPTERLAFFDPVWNRGNTVLMHREPEGIWRIDYQLPEGETAEQALSTDSLHERINAQLAMMGITADWEMDWCSVYSARAMTLDNYRHGRVLFCGDAAHLLPIFGVRGANTGLQDAQNLSWKLAMVVKQQAGATLLDSYSAERVAAAREIIDEAGKSTRFMTPPSRGYRLLRDAVLSLSLKETFVGPLFHWRTSRAHDYRQSLLTLPDQPGFVRGPEPGAPLLNMRLREDYLLDYTGNRFNLLLFSDNNTVPETIQRQLDELNEQGLSMGIILLSPSVTDSSVTGNLTLLSDEQLRCRHAYGAQDGSVYLVRPDHHVSARWIEGTDIAFSDILEQLLATKLGVMA